MIILFLDDERTIKDVFWIKYPEYTSVTVVRNLQEFKAAVRMIESFKDYLFSSQQIFIFQPKNLKFAT